MESNAGLRYLARQPILDLGGSVHAYELLFRAGPEAAFRGDGDQATRTMLDSAVVFGLERLTGGLPACVNCTVDTLTGNFVCILPPRHTVLEILETVEPTPEVLKACHRLRSAGFRFALDDFVGGARFEPLLPLVDYIKVDFRISSASDRCALFHMVRGLPVHMLAEKVETQQDFEQAHREGFTLFQGYYFCRPTMLKGHRIPANRIAHFKLLEQLQRAPLDLGQITGLVKSDAALTYRLLRLVNSPAYAFRQEITSIKSALIAVGEDVFRRIATLAIACELNTGQPREILHMALVRGRFCEQTARLCGLQASEQYLLGMLSLLPAMVRMPVEELTPLLPLRNAVRAALEGRACPERILLDWLESHERCNWAACDEAALAAGLAPELLAARYAEAVGWAHATLHREP